MSKKREKIRIGNYLISKYGKEIERIKVETISGDWNISFPNFSPQFKLIRELSKDEDRHKELGIIIMTMYMSCTLVPDVEYVNNFIKSYNELCERFSEKVGKEVTKENEKDDISAARVIYDIQKEAEEKNENI